MRARGEAFHIAVDAYPMTVRRYAIITNIVAGLVLILGALFSFLKDRRRTYNLLIFVGGVMPAFILSTALRARGQVDRCTPGRIH